MNVWDFKNDLDLIVMASTSLRCSKLSFDSFEDGEKGLSYTFFYHDGEEKSNNTVHVYGRGGKVNRNELIKSLGLELEKLFPTKEEEVIL